MRSFAHIVNPVIVDSHSDLKIAQPVTFETMDVARKAAINTCDIGLYTAQYSEDHPIIPAFFIKTDDLQRSMLNFGNFGKAKKLPLIRDVLDRLYNASDAEYLIYTNVDIALMPNFYTAVNRIIDNGIDSLVITRRTISDRYSSVEDLPLMYAEVGKSHFGYDCFVFRRDIYPRFNMGNICIGAAGIGALLLINMARFSTKFREFSDLHLTFHIGNTRTWKSPGVQDTRDFNLGELNTAARKLAPEFNASRLPEVGEPDLARYFDSIRKQLNAQGDKNQKGPTGK